MVCVSERAQLTFCIRWGDVWFAPLLLALKNLAQPDEKNPLPEGRKEELLLPFTGALPPPDGQRGGDRDQPGALPLSPESIFQPLLGSALPSIGWCCPHSVIPLQTLYVKSSQLLILPESLGGVYCVVLSLCCSLILYPFLLAQHSLRCSITGATGIYKACRWNNFWCPISQKTFYSV